MGKFDMSGKRVLHLFAEGWAKWVLKQSQLTVLDEISGDFQFVSRASDSLLKVRTPGGEPFLLLTELQLRYPAHNKMERRLAAYAALAREKFGLDVYVVVIYLLPAGDEVIIGTEFHREFMGQTAHQDFQTRKMWQLDALQALRTKNPVLLPFIPLMKGGTKKSTIQTCIKRIEQEEEAEELGAMMLAFASAVMDIAILKQLTRWDMQVLLETPFFQEIIEENREPWIEEGREEGLQKGLQEGIYRSTLRNIQRYIAHFFQLPLDYYDDQLESLDLTALEGLSESMYDIESRGAFEKQLLLLEQADNA
ncbi:MAG: hypothetical protein AAF639_45195 [Chloroflexota bacterium]